MDITVLVERAQNTITQVINTNTYFLDDAMWGERVFELKLFKYNVKDIFNCKVVACFKFIYKEDTDFYGDLDTQYTEWITQVLEDLDECGYTNK